MIEPIRKPRNKLRYQLERHKTIARSIEGCLYSANGKVYLLEPKLNFNSVAEILTSYCESSCHAARQDAVKKLYSSSGQATIVERDIVNRAHLSLQYWSRWLSSREGKKAPGAEKQRLEVTRLKARIEFLFGLLKHSRFRGGILLSKSDLRAIQKIVAKHEHNYTWQPLSEVERELAKIVYAIKGSLATHRFVAATLMRRRLTSEKLEQVESSLQFLKVLDKRRKTEQYPLLARELKCNQQLKFLIEVFSSKDYWKYQRGGLPMKIENLRSNLKRARGTIEGYLEKKMPANLAAWAICDSSNCWLPQAVVDRLQTRMDVEILQKAAKGFIAESSDRKYPKAISILNEHRLFVTPKGLFKVLVWLRDGATEKDVVHVIKNFRVTKIGYSVRPKKLVRIAQQFKKVTGEEFANYNREAYKARQELDVLHTLLNWFQSFDSNVLTPRLQKKVFSLVGEIQRIFACSLADDYYEEAIKRWAHFACATKSALPGEADYPGQLRRWLRRLGFYQYMLNRPFAVPRSVTLALFGDEKRSSEFDYLCEQVKNGNASDSMKARFNHLLSGRVTRSNDKRALRLLQKTCFETGVRALKRQMESVSRSIWEKATACPTSSSIKGRFNELAGWASRMKDDEKALLQNLCAAYNKSGRGYRNEFIYNRRWYRFLKSKGFDVDVWRTPAPRIVDVMGANFRIEISLNPYEIFQMGTHFGTCLRQSGCNEMSVLPNAIHGNKHVVFAYDSDGRVVGRQLIAVSKDLTLLGYHCYVSYSAKRRGLRDGLIGQMAIYSAKLAQAMGIKLGRNGAPETFENHEWWDDDPVAWHRWGNDVFRQPVDRVVQNEIRMNPSATSCITAIGGLGDGQTAFHSFVVPDWEHYLRHRFTFFATNGSS